MFSEVSRIFLGREFCMYGVISVIDISVVSSFKKDESLLRLILFISLLNCTSWFTLSLRESLVICWKSMVLVTLSNIRLISARWGWFFIVLITYKKYYPLNKFCWHGFYMTNISWKITWKINRELWNVITVIWMSYKAKIMSNIKRCINESK